MKKHFLFFILFFASIYTLNAQQLIQPQQGRLRREENNMRQEKIKALYVAYITNQLLLTPNEAEKFWPIHTQYQAEIKNVNKNLPELDRQQQILDTKKKYQVIFSHIIGTSRSENFFKLDGEFKRKLLDRFNKQKNN